jgi:hypothetical protein
VHPFAKTAGLKKYPESQSAHTKTESTMSKSSISHVIAHVCVDAAFIEKVRAEFQSNNWF